MIKTTLYLTLIMAAAACSAQVQNETEHGHKHLKEHVHEGGMTVKPGASVQLSHTLHGKVNPGASGVITVTIEEAYDAGVMAVSAASTGLSLAANSAKTSFSLSGVRSHDWDIYFDAPNAGRHYVDVIVTVTDADGAVKTRSYSAPVFVGDNNNVVPKTNGVTETDSAGQPIIVMEAVEKKD